MAAWELPTGVPQSTTTGWGTAPPAINNWFGIPDPKDPVLPSYQRAAGENLPVRGVDTVRNPVWQQRYRDAFATNDGYAYDSLDYRGEIDWAAAYEKARDLLSGVITSALIIENKITIAQATGTSDLVLAIKYRLDVLRTVLEGQLVDLAGKVETSTLPYFFLLATSTNVDTVAVLLEATERLCPTVAELARVVLTAPNITRERLSYQFVMALRATRFASLLTNDASLRFHAVGAAINTNDTELFAEWATYLGTTPENQLEYYFTHPLFRLELLDAPKVVGSRLISGTINRTVIRAVGKTYMPLTVQYLIAQGKKIFNKEDLSEVNTVMSVADFAALTDLTPWATALPSMTYGFLGVERLLLRALYYHTPYGSQYSAIDIVSMLGRLGTLDAFIIFLPVERVVDPAYRPFVNFVLTHYRTDPGDTELPLEFRLYLTYIMYWYLLESQPSVHFLVYEATSYMTIPHVETSDKLESMMLPDEDDEDEETEFEYNVQTGQIAPVNYPRIFLVNSDYFEGEDNENREKALREMQKRRIAGMIQLSPDIFYIPARQAANFEIVYVGDVENSYTIINFDVGDLAWLRVHQL